MSLSFRLGMACLSIVVVSCTRSPHFQERTPAFESPREPSSIPIVTPSAPPSRMVQGGSIGNGGDEVALDEGRAWFLGDAPIQYCIVFGENFGMSEAAATQVIDGAMETWRHYLVRKDINNYMARPERYFPGAPKLVFNHQRMPSCDGTEDLKFYLGIENGEIAPLRRLFQNPVGFAHLTSYDHARGWGKGLIWVAGKGTHSPDFPDWGLPTALRGIILHELGHVLGCAHVRGTIMDKDIIALLRGLGEASAPYRLDRIDFRRELLLTPVHQSRTTELFARTLAHLSQPSLAFSPSIPAISRRAWVKVEFVTRVNLRRLIIRCELCSEGSQLLEIEDLNLIALQNGEAPIFKIAFLGEIPVPAVVVSHTQSALYFGRAKVRKLGGSIPVTVNLNNAETYLSVHALRDGRTVLLFEAD